MLKRSYFLRRPTGSEKTKKQACWCPQKMISSVDMEPTLQSPSGLSAQPPAHPPTMVSSSTAQPSGFVTSEPFMAMSDKWAEQFARMEALLSRGNIFSTPVSAVKPV